MKTTLSARSSTRSPASPSSQERAGSWSSRPLPRRDPAFALPHPGHHLHHPEKCACGRTSYRMEKVRGRSDDMLIIRGVNVFPSQIEEILLGMDDVGANYEIVVSRDGYLDQMEVRVELANGQYLETFTRLEGLTRKIKSRLKTVLGIDAKVTLCEPNTLQRFEGKAKRVIDQRNLTEK